jgi:preprotein translocase subunit SecA
MFTVLMLNIKNEVLHNLFRSTSNLQAFETFLSTLPQFLMREHGPSSTTANGPAPGPAFGQRQHAAASTGENGENGDGDVKLELTPVRRELPKVGRNEPCPCGSGKKFKNCCGRLA